MLLTHRSGDGLSGRIHQDHHHKVDAEHLIDEVQKRSKARGERMTDVRRDVLIALSRLKKPHSAYQILAELNKKRAPKLSAMSLYRTLDFLIELGVVIKLESQNAYQLCSDQTHDHSHLMMICDVCGGVRDVDDASVSKKLQNLARQHGHVLKHHVIELHGSCAKCEAKAG
jgi:Fur family zinc uptake transcriptional regulator